MQRNDNFLINLNSHFRKSSLEFTVFGSTYFLLFLLHRNVLLLGIKIRIRIILIEIEFVVHVLPFNFLRISILKSQEIIGLQWNSRHFEIAFDSIRPSTLHENCKELQGSTERIH